MKHMLWMFIISLVLSGCGRQKQYNIWGEYQTEAMAFDSYHRAYLGSPMRDVKIVVSNDVGGLTVAKCQKFTDDGPTVFIRPSVHETFKNNLEYREILIFHELGHCALDRHHTENDSLMRESLLFDRVYSMNRDFYIHELFTQETKD